MDMRDIDKLFTKGYIRYGYSVLHLLDSLDVLAVLNNPFVQKAFSHSEECGLTPTWVVQQLRLPEEQRVKI